MTNHEERLLDTVDGALLGKHGQKWELIRTEWSDGGHRIMSPAEPCDNCGQQVFLVLPKGVAKPVWLVLGELKRTDTLFPQVGTKRHKCGDGESWSVEAALFVETALREWAVTS